MREEEFELHLAEGDLLLRSPVLRQSGGCVGLETIEPFQQIDALAKAPMALREQPALLLESGEWVRRFSTLRAVHRRTKAVHGRMDRLGQVFRQ